MVVVIIIVVYFFEVFIISRFVVPHLRFGRDEIPEEIPESIQDKINELKLKAYAKKEFLELAYEFLGNKYRSERWNTLLKINYLFKDWQEIWEMEGYIPCTQSSFILKIFLIRSGFFTDKEVKRKHVFANFVIHQYLKVEIKDQWIAVDVGEKQRGCPVGKHLQWFG